MLKASVLFVLKIIIKGLINLLMKKRGFFKSIYTYAVIEIKDCNSVHSLVALQSCNVRKRKNIGLNVLSQGNY